jgi:hypothetical protein
LCRLEGLFQIRQHVGGWVLKHIVQHIAFIVQGRAEPHPSTEGNRFQGINKIRMVFQ